MHSSVFDTLIFSIVLLNWSFFSTAFFCQPSATNSNEYRLLFFCRMQSILYACREREERWFSIQSLSSYYIAIGFQIIPYRVACSKKKTCMHTHTKWNKINATRNNIFIIHFLLIVILIVLLLLLFFFGSVIMCRFSIHTQTLECIHNLCLKMVKIHYYWYCIEMQVTLVDTKKQLKWKQ